MIERNREEITEVKPQAAFNHSEEIDKISLALAAAQGDISPAELDSFNPFFKSKYASLNSIWQACRKPLSENELAAIQLPAMISETGEVELTTIVAHSSGQWFKSTLSAPAGGAKNPVQGMGSTLSYLRRYALSAMVGVTSDEDVDGNQPEQAAQKNNASAPHSKKSPPQQSNGGKAKPKNKAESDPWPAKGGPVKLFCDDVRKLTDYFTSQYHLENAIGIKFGDWLNNDELRAEKLAAALEHAEEKSAATEGDPAT